METIFNGIREWFNEYFESCISADGRKARLMALKLEHSKIVGTHARAIAEDERWPASEIELAEILGLLHDVGRFSQVIEFGTFSDERSVNHGERGYSVVLSSEVLLTLPKDIQTILLHGIRYHNARDIPDNLDTASTRFLRLVRDADKLDIFRIIHNAVKQKSTENQPEITLHVDIDGPVNPAALSELKEGQNVSYRNIKSLADFGLAQLAWVYDLNYRYSLQYFVDNDILSIIKNLLPKEPQVDSVIDTVVDYIRSRQSG